MKRITIFQAFLVVVLTVVAVACSNGGSQSITPSVSVVTTITVLPKTANVPVGNTETYHATAQDQFGNAMPDVTFSWSSGVGVTMTGNIALGIAAGASTVTASAGGIASTVAITIDGAAPPAPMLTSITVSPTTVTIPVGGQQQYQALALDQTGEPMVPQPTFSWQVTNPAIATVTSSGLVTALETGSVGVTASADDPVTSVPATLTVTSAPPVLSIITVLPATASIAVGGTQTFTAAAFDQYGNPFAATVVWSSNSNDASVSGGIADGIASGSAVISASVGSVAGTAVLSIAPDASPALSGPWEFVGTSAYSGAQVIWLEANLVSGSISQNSLTFLQAAVMLSEPNVNPIYPTSSQGTIVSGLFSWQVTDGNGNELTLTATASSTSGYTGTFSGYGSAGTFVATPVSVIPATAMSGTVAGFQQGSDDCTFCELSLTFGSPDANYTWASIAATCESPDGSTDCPAINSQNISWSTTVSNFTQMGRILTTVVNSGGCYGQNYNEHVLVGWWDGSALALGPSACNPGSVAFDAGTLVAQ